jgi:molybdate transport system regulatory protein
MNKLLGQITSIESSSQISLIQINAEDDIFSSIVLEGSDSLNYNKGEVISLLFKETEVGLGKNLQGIISLRNRFTATIEYIDHAPILTRVQLRYKKHQIASIISTVSAKTMDLRVGETVEWLVKSNEVTLLKGH